MPSVDISIVSVSAFIMSSVTVTVKVFCSYRILGFSSLSVCFAFMFCHVDISSLYRGIFYVWAPGLCSL